MTYGQGKWDQQFHQTVLFRPGETENKVINLYPEITYCVRNCSHNTVSISHTPSSPVLYASPAVGTQARLKSQPGNGRTVPWRL